jgi:hypothetical protein
MGLTMKRLLFLLMLVPLVALSQTVKRPVSTGNQDNAARDSITTLRANIDSLFSQSSRDTTSLSTRINTKLEKADTASLSSRINAKQAAGTYLGPSDTSSLSTRINAKLAPGDTASLSTRINAKMSATDTASLSTRINAKMTAADTASLSARVNLKMAFADTASLSSRINTKQAAGAYLGPIDSTTQRTYSGTLYGIALSGAGVPSSGLGKNGDSYWDTTGLMEYRKAAGTWRQQP